MMKERHFTNTESPAPLSTIDAYPSASLNKQPLLYPGIRPETSFLLDGREVYGASAKNVGGKLEFAVESVDGSSYPLNEYLHGKNVPVMEDRIPVLAYGANMCPASIYSKFDKVGRPDAHIVPTLYGHLQGYDVVWSGGPGVNGNFIANLYDGPETQDTTVTVGVNFLTKEQLLVMHATELAYDLTMVDVDIDGVRVKACVYAGVDRILMRDGHPVAVEGISAEPGTRHLASGTTRELVDWMIGLPEIQSELKGQGADTIVSADDYVENTRQLVAVKGAKLARKKAIHAALAESGHSLTYKLPVEVSAMQSWANPSTIPTYGEQLQGIIHKDIYVLPTSELPKDDWPDQAKRQLVLRAIGTHHIRMTDIDEVPNNNGSVSDKASQ